MVKNKFYSEFLILKLKYVIIKILRFSDFLDDNILYMCELNDVIKWVWKVREVSYKQYYEILESFRLRALTIAEVSELEASNYATIAAEPWEWKITKNWIRCPMKPKTGDEFDAFKKVDDIIRKTEWRPSRAEENAKKIQEMNLQYTQEREKIKQLYAPLWDFIDLLKKQSKNTSSPLVGDFSTQWGRWYAHFSFESGSATKGPAIIIIIDDTISVYSYKIYDNYSSHQTKTSLKQGKMDDLDEAKLTIETWFNKYHI